MTPSERKAALDDYRAAVRRDYDRHLRDVLVFQLAPQTARARLDAGDYRGAVIGAYYAMLDLARYMLRGIDPKLVVAREHSAIIQSFHKHVVQEMGYPHEIGRLLSAAFEGRLADASANSVPTPERAKERVEAMERFFAAITSGRDLSDP